MSEAEEYIYRFEGAQRETLLHFHQLLTEELFLVAKMRYKIPFYYGRRWICYMNPIKNDRVEFAFVRGVELTNHQGLLESKGRKQVYSVEFGKLADVPMETMYEIIQEAILLDETEPYKSPVKRLKKSK